MCISVCMKSLVLISALACIVSLSACVVTRPSEQQSNQNVKEKTANATAALKRDAKEAAAGLREGWNRDKTALDLNKASKDELASLPNMTAEKADKVIASRPFSSPEQLVTRRILTQAQYDQVKTKVVAKP